MEVQNGMLKENERQADKIVAKVMRITLLIFSFIYLLDLVGIFTVDITIMTIAYVCGAVLLLLPTLIVNVLKQENGWIKYVSVACAAVFVTMLSITLTYHVVALYVYAIAIASLYFSKRLNILATGLTVIGVSVGQLLAFYLHTLQDDNFQKLSSVIIFGIIPRALVLIAVAAIFTMLCARTAALLSNLLGAEEQKAMLEQMKKMKENAVQSSENLYDMISELSAITESSFSANQRIAEESVNLLESSKENAAAVENAGKKMQDVTEQLTQLSSLNHKTALLTEEIEENTKENQNRMHEATASMEQIHKSTNECRQVISSLSEESQEIIGIIQTITDISDQTNILALNATIEAARAGEHGKGFAVVAEEIQKLSQQTKDAVENIETIVHEVVRNTEHAVAVMEQNVAYTQDGMESIQKAKESSDIITSSNGELALQIYEIDQTAGIIQAKSIEVSEGMERVSNNTQQNCNAVEHVTAATQENRAGTESLAEIAEQIKGLSEQLNKVVQE